MNLRIYVDESGTQSEEWLVIGMLLRPELKRPSGAAGDPIRHARLYLDRLRIMHGYDVLDHLRSRFTSNYRGESPYVEDFQHTESWKDANQCLQLCDLLTGSLYQNLVPSENPYKLQARDHLEQALQAIGVKHLGPGYWKQFAPNTLTQHHPKFSAWFWRPTEEGKKRKRRKT